MVTAKQKTVFTATVTAGALVVAATSALDSEPASALRAQPQAGIPSSGNPILAAIATPNSLLAAGAIPELAVHAATETAWRGDGFGGVALAGPSVVPSGTSAAVADGGSGSVAQSGDGSAAVSTSSLFFAPTALAGPAPMSRGAAAGVGGGSGPAAFAAGAPATAALFNETGAFLGLIGPGGLLIGNGVAGVNGGNAGLLIGNGADGGPGQDGGNGGLLFGNGGDGGDKG